jgi:hypothetical protein
MDILTKIKTKPCYANQKKYLALDKILETIGLIRGSLDVLYGKRYGND